MTGRLKFLVDESAGRAIAEYLHEQGYDVLSAAETMRQADDVDILARSVAEKRILITNDKDFGEVIYRSGKPHIGVILLRLHDESSLNRVRVVRAILDKHSNRLPNNFVVATEKQLRVRPPVEPT